MIKALLEIQITEKNPEHGCKNISKNRPKKGQKHGNCYFAGRCFVGNRINGKAATKLQSSRTSQHVPLMFSVLLLKIV